MNTFSDYCVSSDFNLTPINIDDRPRPDKGYQYTPDMLPAAISVASENIFTLTTPSDSLQLLIITTDDTNSHHATNKYESYCVRVLIGY